MNRKAPEGCSEVENCGTRNLAEATWRGVRFCRRSSSTAATHFEIRPTAWKAAEGRAWDTDGTILSAWTLLEQDLERESRGAAGRAQVARLPEVCVRFGQIRCLGPAEAKPFELIDPPQEALAVRTRLKFSTTLCFAVLHLP